MKKVEHSSRTLISKQMLENVNAPEYHLVSIMIEQEMKKFITLCRDTRVKKIDSLELSYGPYDEETMLLHFIAEVQEKGL